MKVRIVCYDPGGWIVSKFAQRLREALEALSVTAEVGQTPDPSADINHHLVYIDFLGTPTSRDTVMVTHVDDVASIRLLRSQLDGGATGICVSRDTMTQMVLMGLPAERLCYVLPAHDEVLRPRPFVIGIATRLYPQDGRKREGILLQLAGRIRPQEFRFVIIGSGWERIVARMREMSFSVDYYPDFDTQIYREVMRSLDYYLYPGTDEGSMGFVDALAAGLPTIATPQGFHLDAPGGLTHPFSTLGELTKVFENIARPRRQLAESVAGWTWPNYGRKHLEIWNFLLSGHRAATESPDGIASIDSAGRKAGVWKRLPFVARLLRGSFQRNLISLSDRARRKARGLARR